MEINIHIIKSKSVDFYGPKMYEILLFTFHHIFAFYKHEGTFEITVL